jgi:hypothetical protein
MRLNEDLYLGVSLWPWNLVSHIKGGMQTVSENRVLRRIFGQKMDEVTVG